MSYPDNTDYSEAIQDVAHALADRELARGKLRTTPLGLPLALSGGFAITYRLNVGAKEYAVRCFHREIPQIEQRYDRISNALKSLSSDYFVRFDFQPSGILVKGKRFPILKMDWAKGDTLFVYLERNAADRKKIEALREEFAKLERFLRSVGVAHGDIQNENVIVAPDGSLRLIDYDGMFVPGMTLGDGTEIGQPHFQHPLRKTTDFGPSIDRFSFAVVDASLQALSFDGSLHKRFNAGGQAIIFQAKDFRDPAGSDVFQYLEGVPTLSETTARLRGICGLPVRDLPNLEQFRSGSWNASGGGSNGSVLSQCRDYLGVYPVLNASDVEEVVRCVGDTVELVGKIVSVKGGFTKRQNRKGRFVGRRYKFICFGNSQQRHVRAEIGADGLAKLNPEPDETWESTWVSVSGLISYLDNTRLVVGITISENGQIERIEEQEALFRLGVRERSTNFGILRSVRNLAGATAGGRRAAAAVSKSNRAVLSGLRSQGVDAKAAAPSAPSFGGTQAVAPPVIKGPVKPMPPAWSAPRALRHLLSLVTVLLIGGLLGALVLFNLSDNGDRSKEDGVNGTNREPGSVPATAPSGGVAAPPNRGKVDGKADENRPSLEDALWFEDKIADGVIGLAAGPFPQERLRGLTIRCSQSLGVDPVGVNQRSETTTLRVTLRSGGAATFSFRESRQDESVVRNLVSSLRLALSRSEFAVIEVEIVESNTRQVLRVPRPSKAIGEFLASCVFPGPLIATPAVLVPSTAWRPNEEAVLVDLVDSDAARRVQERLRVLGYFLGIPDGLWGPRSRRALREFRIGAGLGQDDQWDLETQASLFATSARSGSRISEEPESPFEEFSFPGVQGAYLSPLNEGDARWIQERLRSSGYLVGSVDGVWGLRSRSALRDYKVFNGLGQTDGYDGRVEDALKRPPRVHGDDTFIGTWAANPSACATNGTDEIASINTDKASTAAGSCVFRALEGSGFRAWRVGAECNANGDKWDSEVRLSLSGSTLSWVSDRKGRAIYYRCPRKNGQ
ncbi:peptidoglycan hydrolase-like protein with peptidoglycan-binding domain [Rhodopseudomonas thermotolerans]|uniref:Peptidoglycan hydrolase-like protein with peptidoglycan-binding domain n=2 Tax=Rhodopseudomonas TaxID=1073 RepID=A0A336JLL2_9BRAD|nr:MULTISPECIES: peptidoglycan-binding protein [Rhodopseudomonas]RED42026.1 peptidoglycan hydrolase-like protein with peptidoglycan-binding domain [Rhodopseudomonas pentothenatexigens]REG07487.1 peptidoglycan hydrolase-like protein with peptidoglycan-binding domain [Rhodopseudomonas thermotolerans]SSW89386.1 peptidoglycan hydrolase-like protein with peptidoglycan-binding domain [Rhodopseudomonas pentothenatexigens]